MYRIVNWSLSIAAHVVIDHIEFYFWDNQLKSTPNGRVVS